MQVQLWLYIFAVNKISPKSMLKNRDPSCTNSIQWKPGLLAFSIPCLSFDQIMLFLGENIRNTFQKNFMKMAIIQKLKNFWPTVFAQNPSSVTPYRGCT